MLSAVQVIAEKIVLLKKENNGKLPYGEFSKLWNAGKETYPKMSRRTINNYVKKIESAAENKLPSLVIYRAHGSKVSNLTGSTLDEAESISANINMSISNGAKSGSICDSVSTSNESISEVILGSVTKQSDPCLGGRPKGSTVQAANDLKKKLNLQHMMQWFRLVRRCRTKQKENV
jgi:hypothetical protein